MRPTVIDRKLRWSKMGPSLEVRMMSPTHPRTNQARRSSTRLRGFDYSGEGAYFITLCTHGRKCLFGEIVRDAMVLSCYGRIVEEEWLRTSELRAEAQLDAFVVMPNHIHGVVLFDDAYVIKPQRAHGHAPLRRRPRSLGAMVGGFKAAATKRINSLRRTPGVPVWQRNYFDHVVRNEQDLGRVREYIVNNPLRWAQDENNPASVTDTPRRS